MKKYFSLVLFFAVIGSSCNFSTKPKAEVVEVSEEVLVGGDEDDHGCKASAGYMWSSELQQQKYQIQDQK